MENLHHSDQLLHDGDVEEGEVAGTGTLHVRDDHHALDVQLVGALLFEERLLCQFLIRGIFFPIITLTVVDMIIWHSP